MNYLISKVIKHHLIFSQESFVNVFNFIVGDNDDAVFRVIKNVLEQTLCINTISDQYLELLDPMSMKIEIKH